MARHYKKKELKTKVYTGFDLTKLKKQCKCVLDKYCVCSPKGEIGTNGQIKMGDNTK